jgi:hypothetical protein
MTRRTVPKFRKATFTPSQDVNVAFLNLAADAAGSAP